MSERQSGDARKMSTCSSQGEGSDAECMDGQEQFVQPLKEHHDIDLSEVKQMIDEQDMKEAVVDKTTGLLVDGIFYLLFHGSLGKGNGFKKPLN